MATTTTISQVGEFPLISSMVGDLTMGQAVTLGPGDDGAVFQVCLLYTSPSPRDGLLSRMPSSA